MLCFKFHKNRKINEKFDFLGVKGVVLGGLGLQKLAKLENMFTNIIEGCFCKKKTLIRYFFEVVLHFTLSLVDY